MKHRNCGTGLFIGSLLAGIIISVWLNIPIGVLTSFIGMGIGNVLWILGDISEQLSNIAELINTQRDVHNDSK